MKLTKSRQNRRNILTTLWKKVTFNIRCCSPDYCGQEAYDDNGRYYTHITNFQEKDKAIYLKAIYTFKGNIYFGISKEAWGFFEDTGVSFLLSSDYFGLFLRNDVHDLSEFWVHFRLIKKQMSEINLK